MGTGEGRQSGIEMESVSGRQSCPFTLLTWQKKAHPLPFTKPFCVLIRMWDTALSSRTHCQVSALESVSSCLQKTSRATLSPLKTNKSE